MRIIISPAKRMRTDPDGLAPISTPVFIDDVRRLLTVLRGMDFDSLKQLLGCNDDLVRRSQLEYQTMDLDRAGTPALIAYDGIQYQYMAPQVFEQHWLDYVQAHLRILSGLYGVLRPLDAVAPYRLEMQARLSIDGYRNLYQFWGNRLARETIGTDGVLLNLASEEYARAVRPHRLKGIRWIDCLFGEMEHGRFREKGVYVKMARGEAVRFLAENAVDQPDDLRAFNRLGFSWSAELSDSDRFVFLMNKNSAQSDF